MEVFALRGCSYWAGVRKEGSTIFMNAKLRTRWLEENSAYQIDVTNIVHVVGLNRGPISWITVVNKEGGVGKGNASLKNLFMSWKAITVCSNTLDSAIIIVRLAWSEISRCDY